MDIDFRLQHSTVTLDQVHKETYPNVQEPEVHTSKRPSKKGRRRRKRAKVKRENSVEGEEFSKPETFPNSEKGIKTFKTSKVLNFFGMKRFDKIRSSCPKPNKSEVSWLDAADTELSDDDQIVPTETVNELEISKISSLGSKQDFSKNSKISWLDAKDDDESFYKCEIKSIVKIPDETDGQNSNLNQYRSRFFNASQLANVNESHSENNWNKKLSEPNMTTEQNANDCFRSGVSRKKDKYDGTKRSRRKTEPFDFSKQADGDLDENELSNSLPDFANTYRSSWEIPSGLCNFMADNNENSPKYQMKNSPSGSIYGKGLFLPFADFDGKLTRELSLEKIFNEEYSDGSDSGTECVAEEKENKENSESEDDDDQWQNEIVEVLPPEPQLGNVEYKLKLVNPTRQRFEHLVTQMKWRLREGQGEALYEIGVRDCGLVQGLAPKEMRASLRTLHHMASRLSAECTLLGFRRLPETRRTLAEVLVRKIPDDQHNIEVRVAVMGSNDAGKSTLVGVLTQGELDNGRGSARLNMFRHLHEVKTGRTSSISQEILGFDSKGRPVNYAHNELITSEEINERSSKLVSFIDLAGHRKYLKTTVQGLIGYSPHYAMLVVSATAGITQMTHEHLALLVALKLPFFIVVTKTDVTPPDQIIKLLENELKSIGFNKMPLLVTDKKLVITAIYNLRGNTVPILPVSSVTGKGLDVLRWFLFIVSPTTTPARLEQEPIEFQVDEIFKIGDVNGPVVGGLLKKGMLTEKTKLLIGPLDTGNFVPIFVNSLHRNKVPCRVVRAGQAASLGLSWLPPGLRQGMFLLAIPSGYSINDNYLQTLTNKFSNTGVSFNKKDKISNVKQDSSLINIKLSPKLSKKCDIVNALTKSKKNVDANDEQTILSNDVQEAKNSDKQAKESNQNKVGSLENKIVIPKRISRLSPSRYANRFTSIFTMDTDESIINMDNEKTEESVSSVYSNIEENSDCTCVDETNEHDDTDNCDEINVTEDPNNPRGCYFFQAMVSLLNRSAGISRGCQCTVHIGSIRQTAVIEGIFSNDNMKANEKSSVIFRFMRHPEYVRTGDRILFREALHTKGVGRITQVFPHKDATNMCCDKHKPKYNY